MPDINKHFRREALIMLGLLPLAVLIGLFFGVILPWLISQVVIDGCLDAGHQYNYEENHCQPEADSVES